MRGRAAGAKVPAAGPAAGSGAGPTASSATSSATGAALLTEQPDSGLLPPSSPDSELQDDEDLESIASVIGSQTTQGSVDVSGGLDSMTPQIGSQPSAEGSHTSGGSEADGGRHLPLSLSLRAYGCVRGRGRLSQCCCCCSVVRVLTIALLPPAVPCAQPARAGAGTL